MTTDYTIDAAGQKLGRIASQAAKTLMGKVSASYTPHIDSRLSVHVINVSKLFITEKKRLNKMYTTYSGHPGGLKREMLGALIARKGIGEALKRAIERMLPRNATRKARMKRLTISD